MTQSDAEISATPPAAPHKPCELLSRFEESGDTIRLSVGPVRGCGVITLTLFFLVLTVGYCWLLEQVSNQGRPILYLWVTPFFFLWLSLFIGWANVVFGRYEITLNADGLAHRRRLLVFWSQRRIPLADLLGFRVQRDSGSSADDEEFAIEARSLGRSITFGPELPDPEQDWLAHHLSEHLKQLQQRASLLPLESSDLADCRHCLAPADCIWQISERAGDCELAQRGALKPDMILAWIMMCGFWNGGVAIFVSALFLDPGDPAAVVGPRRWGFLLLFLPFAALGLVLLAKVMLSLAEPFRRTRWNLQPGLIEQETTWLGMRLGRRYEYGTSGPLTAAIRNDLGSSLVEAFLSLEPTTPAASPYALILASENHEEVCTIKDLTLGEARWIKGRLQELGYVTVPADN